MLLEVCEKGSVREVLKTGGIVGHDVRISWDELSYMAVAMVPLVLAGEDALVSRWSFSRDCSLSYSRYGRCVVSGREDGGVSHGMVVRDDAYLG